MRTARLRSDVERGMSRNLQTGIALSHALLRFTGVAVRTRDLADLEDLDNAHGPG